MMFSPLSRPVSVDGSFHVPRKEQSMTAIAELGISETQESFAQMMPEIESRAAYRFARLDPEAREEALAETFALSWQNYLHCMTAQKHVAASSLAHYAMLSVRYGRRLCRQSSSDVLAEITHLLGRACVQSLNAVPEPATAEPTGDNWWDSSECLVDRRIWERPLERVRLRHDYGRFLGLLTVTPQERLVFRLLTEGHGTNEIASRLRVTAPRVCQLKGAIGRKLALLMGPDIQPGRRARARQHRNAGRSLVGVGAS